MNNVLTGLRTVKENQHSAEVLRLFKAKHKIFYKDGVQATINKFASQTDLNFFKQSAAELLATLASLPESTKLDVKHRLVQWMTNVTMGKTAPTTVIPLLKIMMSDGKSVDSFDVWRAVNRYFKKGQKKLIFPFPDLPYELRLMVYENYFALETTGTEERLIIAYPENPRGAHRFSLLRVNHQIYDEARKVLYNDFTPTLCRVSNLRDFIHGLQGDSIPGLVATATIVSRLCVEAISMEHVNTLANLLSSSPFVRVRFLTLVATPYYMGPASLGDRVSRTRKRLAFPEFKKRLGTEVSALLARSVGLSPVDKLPALILMDFRQDQKWSATFPSDWNVVAIWRA
ncbi:hypothetical protein ETB97_001408 [Aspergillus alliaceus]|uniref:Uncharacterized protein n=1 Tax=Petromyces alliaceus TaxID=209559 RepID=A0A8H6E737_PETAA|nr:hypothetical protein ETB97_001408 [Aspergillus burnettii]